MLSSRLQQALASGLAPGGDLVAALNTVSEYHVRTRRDARAIVSALARFPLEAPGRQTGPSPLQTLLILVREAAEGTRARRLLAAKATPELIRIFEQLSLSVAEDTLQERLDLLHVLACYGTREGAELVVRAARAGIGPQHFAWHAILTAFGGAHPHRDFVYRALSNPLPEDHLAVCLLASVNRTALAGQLTFHPFDNAEGVTRLRTWLVETDPEETPHACFSTVALLFLSGSERDQLLSLACEHENVMIRIEAAWTSAKLGRETGLQMLADFCLDRDHSCRACAYLEELGCADQVPRSARDPDFRAMAEFADWLSHPNELGHPPDEIEIVDRRTIYWPPERKQTTLWLLKFVARHRFGLRPPEVDCGLVGSMTWCFLDYELHRRPPEDALALHCCWELGLDETSVDDPAEYTDLLRNWPGRPLANATVTYVLEIPHEIPYERRLLVLARAEVEGQQGWAVLDGSSSAWYPAADMPANHCSGLVLRIHVGRRLLGFGPQEDRRRYLDLAKTEPAPTAEEIVERYERLLLECETASLKRKKQLLVKWQNPLGEELNRYAECREEMGQESRAATMIRVFSRLLQLTRTLPSSVAGEAYGSSGAISLNFAAFVDAMIAQGRGDEVIPVIEELSHHWSHGSGRSNLGAAAFKAGDLAVADRLLSLKQSGGEYRWYGNDLILLARVWHAQGKTHQARQLLVEGLSSLAHKVSTESVSDRKSRTLWYQEYRATFVELFPGDVHLLSQMGLPEALAEDHRD